MKACGEPLQKTREKIALRKPFISTETLLAYPGKVRTIQGCFNDGFRYYQRTAKSWKDAGGEHDYSMGRSHYWFAINYYHSRSLDIAM